MSYLINNSSTTSKRSLWPPETKDLWVVGTIDSKIQLTDGKWYDDWASGLGTNTLGYGAYGMAQLKSTRAEDIFREACSLPWQTEQQFAEQFCTAMGTEAVRFFKSGSDALSCAVRLARAFTGRNAIIAFDKCYHGTGDWFGQGLWTKQGIVSGQLIVEDFGKQIDRNMYFELYPDGSGGGANYLNKVAAIVVEPVPKSVLLPPDSWLQHLREVCNEHGILLITDEVVLGYRHTLRGYLSSIGVQADLSCYGKAMAQGAALAACTGRQDIMGLLAGDVHFSNTNNGEGLPLAVAQWTLEQYLQKDVCHQLSVKGSWLRSFLHNKDFQTRGLHERFEVIFDSPEQHMDATRFCWSRGILFPGFCSLAVTHTNEQMARLVQTLVDWRNQCN